MVKAERSLADLRKSKIIMNRLPIFLIILPWLFINAGCQRKEEKPQTAAQQKLKVVTTVAPITSIVENVGGDKIDLAGIIPEGTNSHTFEPIPSDSQLLSSADLIILNGLDLETPTQKLAQGNLKQQASIYSLGDKTLNEADYIFDFSFPRERGRPNPHLSRLLALFCPPLRLPSHRRRATVGFFRSQPARSGASHRSNTQRKSSCRIRFGGFSESRAGTNREGDQEPLYR